MPTPANVERILKNINDQGDPDAPVARPFTVENEMVEIKVSDLRQLCDAFPDHPTSKILRRAVHQHQPGLKVTIEKVQIDAISQNREVLTEVTTEDGVDVERKRLAEADVASTPKAAPQSSNRPPQPRPATPPAL